jgi:hypothetical protein
MVVAGPVINGSVKAQRITTNKLEEENKVIILN